MVRTRGRESEAIVATPNPTPRATARVPSPHQPYPRPYKDTLLLIGSSYLCKGGSGVEWGGDPCGRPGVGWRPHDVRPLVAMYPLAVALGWGSPLHPLS